MKKTYRLEELECAHCAAKMEEAIRRLEGVDFVHVNFFAQKLTLEADDALFEALLKQVAKTIKKIEPDCRLVIERSGRNGE